METNSLPRAGKPVRYHLKIDSGMGRLGTRAAPLKFWRRSRRTHARMEGLMTHFASAADYTSAQTDEQVAYFHGICDVLRAAGITRPVPAHLQHQRHRLRPHRRLADLVRAGHALYGYVSPARGDAPPQLLDVQPALTWKAKMLAVKEIPEGALVGYGGSFRAPRPMRIGILGAGYADGMFHRLSNRGKVIAGGKLTPIFGTVSMDLTTIDLSHTTARRRRRGHTAGHRGRRSLDAQQIAKSRAPSPTTFSAASAPACGASMSEFAVANCRFPKTAIELLKIDVVK